MRPLMVLGLALVSLERIAGAVPGGLAAQECQPLATPKRLPGMNQVLDSAALVADIVAGKVTGPAGMALSLAYPEHQPTVLTNNVPARVVPLGNGERSG